MPGVLRWLDNNRILAWLADLLLFVSAGVLKEDTLFQCKIPLGKERIIMAMLLEWAILCKDIL